MSKRATPPKAERIAEFFNRLGTVPPCDTLDEAFDLVCITLNAVEDELTDIPYNQETSESDGRLYPPLRKNLRDVKKYQGVKAYRHRFHRVFFGENGAIEIQEVQTKRVAFAKSGRDGKGVWQP